MANATLAIMVTLDDAHEGGFQNNPKDRANWTGGQVGVGTLVGTNGGITTLDMPGVDIRNITTAQKISYYLANYWKPLYSQITSQLVANKLFDMGVLFGIGTAVMNLQEALAVVPADGKFGPLTLAETNRFDASLVVGLFQKNLIAHAKSVAAHNPNEAPALTDWIRRINS